MKSRDSRSEVTSGYAVIVHHDVSELDEISRAHIHTDVHTFIHIHTSRHFTLVCPLIAQAERVLESLGRFQLGHSPSLVSYMWVP